MIANYVLHLPFLTRLPQLSIRQHWSSIAHIETGDASRVCCVGSAADDSLQLLRTLCTGTYHVPADRSLRPYMVATSVTQVAQNAEGGCSIAVQVSEAVAAAAVAACFRDDVGVFFHVSFFKVCPGLDPGKGVAGQQPRSLC